MQVDVRADGIAVVTLDGRGPENTVTPAFLEALGDALDGAVRNPRVDAIVLRSGKPDFVVGTDPTFVRSFRFAQDAEDFARSVARLFARLDRDKPVVACVDGAALGAGFELALACTAIVATDDTRTTLGFTEIDRGLSAIANGPLRAVRRAGLRVVLELATTGRAFRAPAALRRGLVDEVVPPFTGLDAACALARSLTDPRRRRALHRTSALDWLDRAVFERSPLGRRALFRNARAELKARTRGHEPAAERSLTVLEQLARKGFRSAADLEPRLFGDSVVSESANRRLELFFARKAVDAEPIKPGPLGRIGIVGAGHIGAGVALVSAEAGLDVRLKDTERDVADRGLRDAFGTVASLPRRERASLIGKVTRTDDYARLQGAALVLEAVSEDIALKRRVIGEIERIVPAGSVIATSTAALAIREIAAGARHPERIVGMRFFKPVARTELVEVVRTKTSDARAVATAVALGRRQGKTAIVVEDQPAFFAPRILVPFVGEALRLVEEGVAIDAVDDALVDWGFPYGPLRLLDEVGLRTGGHVADVAAAAFGERLAVPTALVKLREDRRWGRRFGRGLYLGAVGLGRTVDPSVYGALGVTPRPKAASAEEIALRCGLAMVNEALRALGDGVIQSARDGDVAAVLGAGFPKFRGGPFRYVDVLGLPEILRRVRTLEQRFGARFEPAPLLVEMTRSGRRFY